MLTYPNAKINIGLNIVSKRLDGFHNIESCFFPVKWHDALEVLPSETFSFQCSGLSIPSDGNTNLCERAYTLLKADFPALQPIKIHLHKNIPIGAGLGGGSADAAFSLKALNQLQGLGLSREVLEAYALALGSDCPFFIANEPKIAKGRGEIFEDVQINLSGWQILLVFPGIHVSTKEAYTGITPKKADYNLTGTLSQSPENWRGVIKNDFEPVVFDKYPAIAAIKNEMYEIGAVYASMSGTGSCVYGIFPVHVDIPQPASWQNYTICVSSHP